jgi:hypothetical protein
MKDILRRLFKAKYGKRLLICAIILIPVIGYLGRGFIRNTVFTGVAHVIYAHSVNKVTDDVRNEVQGIYPFGQIKYIEENKATCDLSDANYLRTEIYCGTYLFRGQVSIKGMTAEDATPKADSFQRSLEAAGWTAEGYTDGVKQTYAEPYYWWYLAQYRKTTGKIDCRLTIERDNDPDLLNTYLGCERDVFFF